MSHFFEGYEDSDEEIQEVDTIDEVEDDDASDNKWFQPDDDEDEDQDDDGIMRVKSKKERTSDEIADLCDEMDFDIEVNWQATFKKFLSIIDKSRKFITSEGVPPVSFIQCIVHLQECLAAQQDAKKDDYEDVKEFTSLRQLMKKHSEIYEEFEFHCKKLQETEEDESGEGDKKIKDEKEEVVEEWTEESMIGILNEINVAAKKNRASRSGEVAKHAKMHDLPHIAIAALALQCTTLMEEDTREAHVTSKVWVRALECANEAFVISEKNKKITVADRLETNGDNYTTRRTVVTGGFSILVARLHQEFVLACSFAQKTNPEYIERVKEEKKLQIFASNVLRNYTRKGTKRFIAEVSLVLLQIVAPRTAYAHKLLTAESGDEFLSKDSMELTADLTKSISENTHDTSACLHASLLEAYQTALAGKYYECLDLSLRRRLQESVQTAEKKLRLLYNRVTAQMGIAAFRCGQYLPAFQLLNPLVQPRNQELLLGQRAIRYRSENVDPKVEFERRKLLVPPHHHIACDVVELICVISTMIVEGVSAAKKPFKYKKRDENFLTMLESQKSGTMIRDKYVAASKAFKEGAVKDTWNAIMSIDAIQDIPDADVVIPQVHKRIKEDALRVFIISNAKSLDSLAVEWMCEMFELNADEVKVTVTQLLLDHEAPLVAFWDETEEFLLIERSQTTRLHHLAASLADKVASLPTQSKSGSHGYGRGRGRGGYRGGRGVSTN